MALRRRRAMRVREESSERGENLRSSPLVTRVGQFESLLGPRNTKDLERKSCKTVFLGSHLRTIPRCASRARSLSEKTASPKLPPWLTPLRKPLCRNSLFGSSDLCSSRGARHLATKTLRPLFNWR
jgi:hypothetical protein